MNQDVDPARIALTIFEAWNESDYDRARGVIAEDFEAVEVGSGKVFAGPEGLRDEFELWRQAFSDGKIEVKNVIAAGDQVAIESVVQGTHDGPFVARGRTIEASGRWVEFPMCTIAHIKDGKSRLERHYFDMAGLLSALGA